MNGVIVDQKRWGICGFVSVLNGLRTVGLIQKLEGGEWKAMGLEEIQTRLYAEIVTYLKYLIFTRSSLVGQIEEITDICRPKGEPKRSVQEIVMYIEGRLRGIAAMHHGHEGRIRYEMRSLLEERDDTAVTVAMTPESLIDYMKWAGVKNPEDLKVKTTGNTSDNLLSYKNCVIGLGENPGRKSPYNGLEHWIYVDGKGELNNWGAKTTLVRGVSGTELFGKWAKFITQVIKMG